VGRLGDSACLFKGPRLQALPTPIAEPAHSRPLPLYAAARLGGEEGAHVFPREQAGEDARACGRTVAGATPGS